jgi:hypothetical protein
LDVELATEKLKSHKSPGIDQIPAELIKAGGRTIRCAIHKLIIAIWNKEELPKEWKESIIYYMLIPLKKNLCISSCKNFDNIKIRYIFKSLTF